MVHAFLNNAHHFDREKVVMAVVCTKLVQWLSFGGLFMAVWAALLAELLPIRLTPQLYEVILPVSHQIYA